MWNLPDIDSNQCQISVTPNIYDDKVVCFKSGSFAVHRDYIHPNVPSKWQSLGGNYQRTGLSREYGPQLGRVKWQFEVEADIFGSVTIGAGDRLHIAAEDGRLYTLDGGDGSLLWTYDTGAALVSSPSVGPNGSVYVGSQDGRLFAVSIGGRLRWTHATDGTIYSSPAVSNEGNVYVCSLDGKIYALGQDGSELWNFTIDGPAEGPGSIIASPSIAEDGTIYVAGYYYPKLYAINPDGSLKWVHNFENIMPTDPPAPPVKTWHGLPFASPVVGPDGTIYQILLHDTVRFTGSELPDLVAIIYGITKEFHNANLYAINHENGEILWTTTLSPDCDLYSPSGENKSYWFGIDTNKWCDNEYTLGWSEPAIGPDGTIYVAPGDPYLRAVSPDGEIKWVINLGMVGGSLLTVGGDGYIYASGDDGYLSVISPDGKEVSNFHGAYGLGFPVITSNGTIVVNNANNDVIAIEDAAGRPLDLHWIADIDANKSVDFTDYAIFATDWLKCTEVGGWMVVGGRIIDNLPCTEDSEVYLSGDINRDGYVMYEDLAELAERWLIEY